MKILDNPGSLCYNPRMGATNLPATYHSPAMIDATLGPAMRALNERQQAFVDYVVTTGTKNFAEAAREVGYSQNLGTSKVIGHKFRHSQGIADAIIEEGKRRVNLHLPMALQTAITIASDPSHKDALKAALALMAMSGVSPVTMSKTETHVIHHGTPLENIEARLAVLPPDVADMLRKQLLPAKIIDITPDPTEAEIMADLKGLL